MKTTFRHLEALDVFRGVTVAAMVLVNNPGNWSAVFPRLQHSDWNGCTFADVVFPFFVFIMGCAMPYAFANRPESDQFARRVVRRGATLVALGLVLNLAIAVPHVAAIRIPGVLQRLGVTYVATAFLVRGTDAGAQAVIALLLMLAHWAFLTLPPFGASAATLTPMHNLAGYIDSCVFGTHMLTSHVDPEGIVGSLPTIASALMGALAGHWLRRNGTRWRRVSGLLAAGVFALVCGLAWASVWPLNKSLWSGSYAMATGGLAAITLAVFLVALPREGSTPWARPFSCLGANALVIYFLSELGRNVLERPVFRRAGEYFALKDWFFWQQLAPLVGDSGGAWSSLVFALLVTALWMGVAGVLCRRGVRIRI